jgi:nucleotide-binding universal stress UspA family protein
MYNTILLTIDLSHEASWKKALPDALEMARIAKAELHVLSVVPDFGTPLVSSFFPSGFEKKALAKAKGELDALLAKELPDDVSAKKHVAFGAIHSEILKGIDKVKPDLVIMASHKPDTMREFFVGSEADRVVRRAKCSVLVVRG